MKQVYDNLYVGDKNDADNPKRLEEENINYILNVANTCSQGNKNYFHTPLTDNEENTDFTVETVIETAQKLHEKAEKEDTSLLIHCSVGSSRSVAIAASLISLNNGKRVKENVGRIEVTHPIANPEPELLKQVSRLTSDLYNA